MATTFVLTRPDVFVSGTVAAYVKPALGVPASGAPSGSAVSSPSVVGNSVTFTGLADNTQYIAYQGSPDRYVSFRTTPAASGGGAETDPVASADLVTHAALTTSAHGGIAPSASPTFTGTPAAPTATQGTNTTQVATTAYVQTEVGLLVPKSLVDAKGDLLIGTADNTVARVAVGSNQQILVADSAQTPGVRWGNTRADRKRASWSPTGAIDETLPFGRMGTMGGNSLLATGRLQLAGGVVVLPGDTITNIVCVSGSTAAATCTHCWFCLVRQSDLAVLAKTVDDTAAAPWGSNTAKSLALSAPLSVTTEAAVLIGMVVVGTTMPFPLSINTVPTSTGAPIVTGSSTTGLTDPASLGANAGAITAATAMPYAYLT